MAPIASSECADPEKLRAFGNPNQMVKNDYLEDELTALGWAVYFCYTPEAEDAVRVALAHAECDPFIPMPSGFFRGKTAREIALYYDRRSVVQLIEACERTKDQSLRSAGDAARKQLEQQDALKPPATLTKQRRESRFSAAMSRSALPVERKVRTPAQGNHSSATKTASPLPETVLDSATRKEKEKEVLKVLEKADIPVGEQVLLSATLVKAGLTDIDSITRADPATLQRLRVKPVLATKLAQLKDVNSPDAQPTIDVVHATPHPIDTKANVVTSSQKTAAGDARPIETSSEKLASRTQVAETSRSPSPLLEDPAERVPVGPASPQQSPRTTVPASNLPEQVPSMIPSNPRRFQVFLSFSFGPQQIYRSRVRLLARVLESKGATVWLTEDKADDDVVLAISRGMDQSMLFVPCLSRAYMDKVNALKTARFCAEWCAIEYATAVSAPSMGIRRVFPILLERSMADQSRWSGELAALKNPSREQPDFSSELDFDTVAEAIIRQVARVST